MDDNYLLWILNIFGIIFQFVIQLYFQAVVQYLFQTDFELILVSSKPWPTSQITVLYIYYTWWIRWLRLYRDLSILKYFMLGGLHSISYSVLHDVLQLEMRLNRCVKDLIRQLGTPSAVHVSQTSEIGRVTCAYM